MKERKGLFISWEGGEGSGKTTQLRILAERLRSAGHQVICTREPGGCPIADQVRSILLDAANAAIVPTAELLLYAASRAQHVSEVIVPALERGEIVLCDRFDDSSVAYQGSGRGLDMELIRELNRIATGGLRPDLTMLFDIDPEIGVPRSLKRLEVVHDGPNEERMELESMNFHRRLRQGYLDLAAANPERFVIVDAAPSIEVVSEAVIELIERRYPQLAPLKEAC